MRRPMVAANWKMNGSRKSAIELISKWLPHIGELDTVDLVVCPPAIYLPLVADLVRSTRVGVGAQTTSEFDSGAYTGEISSPMLSDMGVRYVIVGHSERRSLFGETSDQVALKLEAVLRAGLIPILCVGETRAEREHGATWPIIQAQLSAVLRVCGNGFIARAIIAYEPVWAIGTGLTATPEQAQEVHADIRKFLSGFDAMAAQELKILYGGSVKSSNASALFACADIDGGLVGGASLDSVEFLGICKAARNTDRF